MSIDTINLRQVCGLGVVILVVIALSLIKKIDKEHGLPGQIPLKTLPLCWFAGTSVSADSLLSVMCGCVLMVYLCFMAYVDHHTGQVYSFCSYIVGGIGGILLWIHPMSIPAFGAFFVGVAVITVLKGFSLGDSEIWIAAAPYLLLQCGNSIYVLLAFMILSLLYFLFYAFVIRRVKAREYCATVPAIAAAAVTLQWLY